MSEKLLLLEDQAIALGALHAGISGVYAYPGSPATEITEYIQQSPVSVKRNVYSDWCTNEKTAMEAALEVSYVGKRSLVCMKHVGLNVAADAFINSAITGTHGGLVVVAVDDPSMHSSQNEQDSRFYGKFALVPIFEPSSQQEAYDMVRAAFDLSEQVMLPVLVRLTTRMAHSRAIIRTRPAREQNRLSFPEDRGRWLLLPSHARRRYNVLLAQQASLGKASEESPFNRYAEGSDKGIIACGIAYNYLMEAFDGKCDRTILKISQYPLPGKQIRQMMHSCREILVLEDGQPFVEEQLRGVLDESGKIKGRLSGEIPRAGELTPDQVKTALGVLPEIGYETCPDLVPRPPAFCDGCGHKEVYEILNTVIRDYPDAKVFSDIGCYTLGGLPPLRAIDSCVDMGASIPMAKGAADAGLYPSLAVIGDSTFTHSGITGLLDAVNSKSNLTVLISDNLTTAMTGGQPSAGTGKIEDICRGLGVEPDHLHVIVPTDQNRQQIETLIRCEIAYNGVSVIIPRRECVLMLQRKNKPARA
ncbi:MAG: thiamine pyrophosphate-dependent enzyme [Rikenellaceae bacterium]|nr:thiamine pyrophosphate-dependent enzyme [Rikenellaceae bacterium]